MQCGTQFLYEKDEPETEREQKNMETAATIWQLQDKPSMHCTLHKVGLLPVDFIVELSMI